MADSRKLTTDEVNALMEGLSTGDVSGDDWSRKGSRGCTF